MPMCSKQADFRSFRLAAILTRSINMKALVAFTFGSHKSRQLVVRVSPRLEFWMEKIDIYRSLKNGFDLIRGTQVDIKPQGVSNDYDGAPLLC